MFDSLSKLAFPSYANSPFHHQRTLSALYQLISCFINCQSNLRTVREC
uniref:Uncharacterized protein n=1 Tax=Anguilla anguilla TaxID=7936 RepID=A0A0E9S4C4_ANGAN